MLAGLLIAHAGWRSIFLINLPVGLIGLFLAVRHAESGNAVHRHSLDLPGQVAIVSARAALTVALTEAGRLGWQHPWVQGRLVPVRDTAPGPFMRGMHWSLGVSVALLMAASLLCLFGMPEDRTGAS